MSDKSKEPGNKKKEEYWRAEVEKIRSDSLHGSIYLSNRAVDIVEEFIKKELYHNRTELLQSLSKLNNALVRAKPLMALIYNRTRHILEFIQQIPREEKDIQRIKNATLRAIKEMRVNAEKNVNAITQYGARTIMEHHVVLVHSSSRIVESILTEAHRMKRRFRVICTESRPLNEGSRMAYRLAKGGIKTKLIPDADMTRAMMEANFVLTGTDRITETTFINKTGTHALAILARHLDKPLYVAGETDKILLKRTYPVRFLQSAGKEITDKKHSNLSVSNLYFEEIPLSLVEKVFLEDGIFELKEFIDRYL